MESIWIIPLYSIIPIIAFIFIFSGLIRIKKKKSHNRLYFGLILLAIPVSHQVMMANRFKEYEESVIGKYSTDSDDKIVLVIYKSGKFKSFGKAPIMPRGQGDWEVIDWDIMELDLKFEKDRQAFLIPNKKIPKTFMEFEIFLNQEDVELHYDPWQDEEFVLTKRNK